MSEQFPASINRTFEKPLPPARRGIRDLTIDLQNRASATRAPVKHTDAANLPTISSS
jgi:hypothetical protein